MGGVDKCDQYLSYYSLVRKSLKWWVKVFFRLLEMCVVNAMCLYFAKNPLFASKRNSHKKFRQLLAHQLVQPLLDHRAENYVEPRAGVATDASPSTSKVKVTDSVRLTGKHFAVKKYPRRKCSSCAYKKAPGTAKRNNKRTNDYCAKCKTYICLQCFKKFHTVSKL